MGTSYARRSLSLGRSLRGNIGAAAIVAIGAIGQLIWLARAAGAIGLADTLAIEGIVVAIVFGALAVRVALRHEQELLTVSLGLGGVSGTLNGVSQRLEGVSESIQTQPIGEFPDFLPHITDLLAKAEKSITIMCDAPAYGIYSNGVEFDAYVAALKSKIAQRAQDPGFVVDLMFLGDLEREAVQRNSTQRHVTTPDGWVEWRDSDPTAELLRALIRRVALICHPESTLPSEDDVVKRISNYAFDDFVSDFYDVDEALLARDFHGAKRRLLIFRDEAGASRVTSLGPSIYFWMRDGLEAVFVVVPLGEKVGESREIGFRTRDPSMIDALRGVFSRYQRSAISFEGYLQRSQ